MHGLADTVSKAVEAHDELSDMLNLGSCALTKEERCIVNRYSNLPAMLQVEGKKQAQEAVTDS